MRRVLFLILAMVFLLSVPAHAASRVIKVLPQYLDKKGRHALSPSLYERDAYQAFLRSNPKERSGLRININWKSDLAKSPNLKFRVELRSTKDKDIVTNTFEEPAKKNGWFTNWTPLEITGDRFKQFGELIAWHVTLLDGTTEIAEQQSFLW